MSNTYHRLPTFDQIEEPFFTRDGSSQSSRHHEKKSRWRMLTLFILFFSISLIIIHYAVLGAFPNSRYTVYHQTGFQINNNIDNNDQNQKLPSYVNSHDLFYRDVYPLKSILKYYNLSQEEIIKKGIDKCDDILGKSLIEAYNRGKIDYCLPTLSSENDNTFNDGKKTEINCTPVKNDNYSNWWPVPASPCISKNLRADGLKFKRIGCSLTEEGERLEKEMYKERFVGTDLTEWKVGKESEGGDGECEEIIERLIVVVPRQDAWNPFHVAEDMITTLVTVLIALKQDPSLMEKPVQLVFKDDFGLENNHFVSMWDKIGAWPPRRLTLDPFNKACFDTVIHSVRAGVSLLSAQSLDKGHHCASSITWASSHYYRHLFGLQPSSQDTLGRQQRSINILWLSRRKYNAWDQSQNDWTLWKESRNIVNELELINHLRRQLAGLCKGCFSDEDQRPGRWAINRNNVQDYSHNDNENDDNVSQSDDEINEVKKRRNDELEIRFADIDPSVHSLDTQIHFVGNADIIIGLHGGALGLEIFMNPGQSTVIELSVPNTYRSKHFETMSAQLGLEYEAVLVDKVVDVVKVWEVLERHGKRLMSN